MRAEAGSGCEEVRLTRMLRNVRVRELKCNKHDVLMALERKPAQMIPEHIQSGHEWGCVAGERGKH